MCTDGDNEAYAQDCHVIEANFAFMILKEFLRQKEKTEEG